jgi:hypothetical protein
MRSLLGTVGSMALSTAVELLAIFMLPLGVALAGIFLAAHGYPWFGGPIAGVGILSAFPYWLWLLQTESGTSTDSGGGNWGRDGGKHISGWFKSD